MARYNKRPSGMFVPSPIVSTPSPTARTGNNAPGFVRDPKSELFLLGVANFVGTDTFYEKGKVRDGRFLELVHHLAQEDPDWLGRFLKWLRSEANMRTASIVGAVEAARTMAHHRIPGGRQIVDSVLQRADEPGEALGYWRQTQPGRQIPKPIKRGIADAATRLYNEYNTLKYDTESHGIRFGDVLELCHPKPGVPYKTALFKHLIDRRHKRDNPLPESLGTIFNNGEMRRIAAVNPQVLLSSESLWNAGMTWEDALSLAGSKVSKKDLWEAMIPNMGYMALLRNLRNFDEAGVSDDVANTVIAKLTDPDQVARSRQLPMRFLSAYRSVSSLRWSYPLEQALQLSLRNVPVLTGRTLILIDQSPSMFPGYHFSTSNKSNISLADQAKIFGMALALCAEHADVIQYGGTSDPVRFEKSESLLKTLDDRFRMIDSTDTAGTVRRWWNEMYDRIVVLTDEQANFHRYADVFAPVPANKLAITFNLGGYAVGHAPSGSAYRVTIGGLSDSAFKLLPILEQRAAGQWPF